MEASSTFTVAGIGGIKSFKAINGEIASLTGQVCALKPEISLLLEIYEAERQKLRISDSVIGLAAGIPQTIAIRWLRILEDQGLVTRTRHEIDQHVTNLHLAPWVFEQLDSIFRKRQD